MDFRILGPLEVSDNGRELALSGSKQGAVLAILLLHANEVVPSDRLIDELWGEQAPATAAKSLQVHVSRLRRALNGEHATGGAVVLTRGGGYLVRVGPGELDRERFERMAEEGSRALTDGKPERALELTTEALALWRGPPLADFAYESFAQSEIARLEELHLSAIEQRTEAELALGRDAELVGELEALTTQHPYRERLYAQLMLALYRCGRQTEALQAYQDARRTLLDEVGIEPGERLRRLEGSILAQDPSLEGPFAPAAPAEPEAPRPGGAPKPRRFRVPLALGLLAAAVAVAAVVLLVRDGNGGLAPLTNDSQAVAVIDPSTNQRTGALSVGARPGPLAFDPVSGSLWVGNLDDGTVTRIDPGRRRVGRTLAIGGPPTGLAAGGGWLWVASPTPSTRVRLDKINARFNTRDWTKRVGDLAVSQARLALGGRVLWVAPQYGVLTRVDARTGSVVRPSIDPGHHPTGIGASASAAWSAGGDANTVTRVDSASELAIHVPVGNGPADIALGSGSVWVALALDNQLIRVDPATGAVRKTIPVGRSPAGVAVGAGAVWVANSGDGTVSRIDPDTGEVAATIPVGASPQDVTVADGRVWVSVRPRALPEARPGGSLLIEVAEGPATMDPALGYFNVYELQLGQAAGARLLNYPDAPAPKGSQLQPEVAEALPTRSADGKTYTFTIRNGFRFSPPSGAPVTARSFRHAIERALSPKMQGPAGNFVADIVGAEPYMEGKAKHIAGITATKDKLTFRLTRAAGDFPTRISMPFFAAVPAETPIDRRLGKVASAGPYYVDSFDPDEGVVLKPNPNYSGGRPHRLAEIRLVSGVGRARGARNVEDGTADYAPGWESIGRLPDATRLARSYGPGSDAAAAGRQRYFINPVLDTAHIALNTSRPLFSSARLRRAANYAIDRRALAAVGSPDLRIPSVPSDQYLPPGMPGFSDAHIYPLRPDLAQARRLAGDRHRTAVLYAYDRPPSPQLAQIVKSNLKAIGIDVEVKLFSKGVYFKRITRTDEPYDMAMTAWFAEYADPADFLNLLDGRTLDPSSPLGGGAFLNVARYDDPVFNRRLLAAEKLTGPRRYAAYTRIEHDMVRDGAPWIALANDTSHDFFSARTGCQVYQPVFGIDLAALCIRR